MSLHLVRRPRRLRRSMRTIALALFSVSLGQGSAAATEVRISELLYDAVGADAGRVFVELWGPAGLDLQDWTLRGVNGANGAVAPVLALSGSIPADGFFVLAGSSGGVTEIPDADLTLAFDFQNGPDSVLLVGPGGLVRDALGYGTFGAGETFAGEGTPAPDAPPGSSLARIGLGVDTDDNAVDFAIQFPPTPGAGPSGAPIPEPGAAVLLITALSCIARVARRK